MSKPLDVHEHARIGAFELYMDVSEWDVNSLARPVDTTTQQPPTFPARTRTVLPLTVMPMCREGVAWAAMSYAGPRYVLPAGPPLSTQRRGATCCTLHLPHSTTWYVRRSVAPWTWPVRILSGYSISCWRSGVSLGSWVGMLVVPDFSDDSRWKSSPALPQLFAEDRIHCCRAKAVVLSTLAGYWSVCLLCRSL